MFSCRVPGCDNQQQSIVGFCREHAPLLDTYRRNEVIRAWRRWVRGTCGDDCLEAVLQEAVEQVMAAIQADQETRKGPCFPP